MNPETASLNKINHAASRKAERILACILLVLATVAAAIGFRLGEHKGTVARRDVPQTVMPPAPTKSTYGSDQIGDQISPVQAVPTRTVNLYDSTETVVIEGVYSFEITIPREYRLARRENAFDGLIEDQSGAALIALSFSFAGGERSPTDNILIDGVRFTLEGGRSSVICGSFVYPTYFQPTVNSNYHPNGALLSFQIYAWCEDKQGEATRARDASKEQIINRIVRSIRFSPALRAVLEGRAPLPWVNSL